MGIVVCLSAVTFNSFIATSLTGSLTSCLELLFGTPIHLTLCQRQLFFQDSAVTIGRGRTKSIYIPFRQSGPCGYSPREEALLVRKEDRAYANRVKRSFVSCVYKTSLRDLTSLAGVSARFFF